MTALTASRSDRPRRLDTEHQSTAPVVVAIGWRTGLVAMVAGAGCLIWHTTLSGSAPATTITTGDPRGLAATFLTTVIAIYAVFLSVYGALIGPLLDRRPDRHCSLARRAAWWTTIVLVSVAVLLGLWRVWNGVGDLYTVTVGAGLGNGQPGTLNARDALEEFRWIWAPINIAIIIVAMRAFLEGRGTPNDTTRRSRTDHR